jgi:hypothetical protein
MKKTILVLLLLLFSLSALYSLEGEFSFSFGVLGLGFNTDFETIGGYGYGRFLNFMYQSGTGFGFSFSPLVFTYTDINNYSLTFVNGLLFYNFLKKIDESFILGPSIGVNAVSYRDPAFVEFSSGLLFSFRSADIYYARDSIFSIDIFFVVLGYRYNKTDGHGFYAHVGVDLISALLFIGMIATGIDGYNDRLEANKPWY